MQTRAVDVRAIDPLDESLLAGYQRVAHRAELFERPWEMFWSVDELRSRFTGTNSSERTELYSAFDGDQMVGGVFIELPLLDNTDQAYVHVSVDPGFRRRGIGSTLLDLALERSRQEGRRTILAESSYSFEERDTHPYRRFAERHGFAVANTEIVRQLRVPVPHEDLEAMAAECAPHHRDYRIETYVDQVPEGYVASYCHLLNQLVADAPMGDLDFEEQAVTPEVYAERTVRMKAAGRTRYTSLGVDPDGVVVAHTDLVLPAHDAHKVLQAGTLVRRDHRGHRLGAAVKVANLLAVQTDHPGRTLVSTTNAEVNEVMVGINDRLGFTPVAVCPTFQRRLS